MTRYSYCLFSMSLLCLASLATSARSEELDAGWDWYDPDANEPQYYEKVDYYEDVTGDQEYGDFRRDTGAGPRYGGPFDHGYGGDFERMPADDAERYEPRRHILPGGARGRRMRTRVEGTLQSIRTFQLGARRQSVVFAKVRRPHGGTAAVILGTRSRFRRLDLEEGDRVRLWGQRARVNGRPVLVTERIAFEDRRVRMDPLQMDTTRWVEGRILETTTTALGPADRRHVIALVRLRNGRRVPVDLGPAESLQEQDVQIRTDRDMIVLAKPARIGDRRILRATKIGLNGRRIDLEFGDRARRGDGRPSDERAMGSL